MPRHTRPPALGKLAYGGAQLLGLRPENLRKAQQDLRFPAKGPASTVCPGPKLLRGVCFESKLGIPSMRDRGEEDVDVLSRSSCNGSSAMFFCLMVGRGQPQESATA